MKKLVSELFICNAKSYKSVHESKEKAHNHIVETITSVASILQIIKMNFSKYVQLIFDMSIVFSKILMDHIEAKFNIRVAVSYNKNGNFNITQ